ncbi:hypothetical protein [Methanonatronarchaeum sp. AMET-Sl]|uniref:hypothetical protein n=1 Tax=Methanonatronarchaeum sp. AMET-Sl TaxID=3037654 RepID=UPI00244E26D7|nr:hypothetical protein [Methanonatronarchaeum sp. AMET-Sl]WGI17005.1 hypothetical protein QEN48_05760 [Methanonatronarchaeum sp. AMET-Sl]
MSSEKKKKGNKVVRKKRSEDYRVINLDKAAGGFTSKDKLEMVVISSQINHKDSKDEEIVFDQIEECTIRMSPSQAISLQKWLKNHIDRFKKIQDSKNSEEKNEEKDFDSVYHV